MKLKRAWVNNDSTYVEKYIMELNQYEVEEMTAKTHYVLSEYTNFNYGMLAYENKEDWKNLPVKKKEILKFNIYTIWKEYVNSRLFMNKDCSVNFQERFWSDKKISKLEIRKIQQTLNFIADSCSTIKP